MKKIINSKNAPAPVGPYNQSILVGDTLYISGQIPINAMTGELILTDIQAETRQVLDNLNYILAEAGMNIDNVVKCTVFVADMGQYAVINEIYASYFGEENAPARELVEVSKLPKDVHIEISAIAVK